MNWKKIREILKDKKDRIKAKMMGFILRKRKKDLSHIEKPGLIFNITAWPVFILFFVLFIISIGFSVYIYSYEFDDKSKPLVESIVESISIAKSNGIFAIISVASLFATILTAILAYIIYNQQKRHSEGLEKTFRYGAKISHAELFDILEEWLEEGFAKQIVCISNFSKVPGFWLDTDLALKIQNLLCNSILRDKLEKNEVKMKIFGPSDEAVGTICSKIKDSAGSYKLKKRSSKLDSEEILNNYKLKCENLIENHISLHELRPGQTLPINILILAKTSGNSRGKESHEAIYGYLPQGLEKERNNPLIDPSIRHVEDYGFFEITKSLAQGFIPEGETLWE